MGLYCEFHKQDFLGGEVRMLMPEHEILFLGWEVLLTNIL